MTQGVRLSQDQINRVAEALENAPSWRAAANHAGLHRRTLHLYQERAESYAERHELELDGPAHLAQEDDRDYFYWQTVQQWLAARSRGEMQLVQAWRDGAEKDWRAAQTFLRATFPQDYSERVEVTGAEGGAIKVQHMEELVAEAAERAQARLKELGDRRPSPGDGG